MLAVGKGRIALHEISGLGPLAMRPQRTRNIMDHINQLCYLGLHYSPGQQLARAAGRQQHNIVPAVGRSP